MIVMMAFRVLLILGLIFLIRWLIQATRGVKSPSATEHPVGGEILAAMGARIRDDLN